MRSNRPNGRNHKAFFQAAYTADMVQNKGTRQYHIDTTIAQCVGEAHSVNRE